MNNQNNNSEEVPEDFLPSELESLPLNVSGDIEKAIAQIINLSPEQILHEPTCLICSNPHRKEAEEKWTSSGKKHSEVRDILKSKSGLDVSDEVIENHMLFHYSKGIPEIKKGEYANKIKRLNSVDLTTMDRIRLCLSALTERLMGINSIIPGADKSVADIEKIKSMETSRLMTSFASLLKLQSQIMGELKDTGEMIMIPQAPFVNIFTEALTNAENEKEVEIIKNILSKLEALAKMSQ